MNTNSNVLAKKISDLTPDDLPSLTPFESGASASAASASSKTSFFSNVTWQTWIIIILILAFLGINVFVYLGKGVQEITDFLSPILKWIGYGTAVTAKQTIDVSADGAKTGINITAEGTKTGVDIISDTATVGASGSTTLNMALATANVKLVINDLAGRPNYEGWITVRDAAGNYVDTGKGWISQLGKVDFTLTTGVYTLEIQPANNRTGVRTTDTITVTSGVLLERTITLAAGNVQGLAKNSSGSNISCAFITATAAGETTLKTISKSDGTYSLNLTAGKSWTISAVDPNSGQVGSATLTPNNTSSNAVTVTTATTP